MEAIKAKFAEAKTLEDAKKVAESIYTELSPEDTKKINQTIIAKWWVLQNNGSGEYYDYVIIDKNKEKTPGTPEYTAEMKKIAESVSDEWSATGKINSPDGTPLYRVKTLARWEIAGIADGDGNVYNFVENKWQMPEEWAQVEKKDKALHVPTSPEYKDHMDTIAGTATDYGNSAVQDSEIPDGVIRDPENDLRFIKKNDIDDKTEEWVIGKWWQETKESAAPDKFKSLLAGDTIKNLGYTWKDGKALWDWKMWEINQAILQIWESQADTTGKQAEGILAAYQDLSEKDRSSLAEVTINEFVEIVKQSGDAREAYANAYINGSDGVFRKLPWKFGGKDYQYAQLKKSREAFRKGKWTIEVFNGVDRYVDLRKKLWPSWVLYFAWRYGTTSEHHRRKEKMVYCRKNIWRKSKVGTKSRW